MSPPPSPPVLAPMAPMALMAGAQVIMSTAARVASRSKETKHVLIWIIKEKISDCDKNNSILIILSTINQHFLGIYSIFSYFGYEEKIPCSGLRWQSPVSAQNSVLSEFTPHLLPSEIHFWISWWESSPRILCRTRFTHPILVLTEVISQPVLSEVSSESYIQLKHKILGMNNPWLQCLNIIFFQEINCQTCHMLSWVSSGCWLLISTNTWQLLWLLTLKSQSKF